MCKWAVLGSEEGPAEGATAPEQQQHAAAHAQARAQLLVLPALLLGRASIW